MGIDENELKARNRALVNHIYAGALNPSEYYKIFEAWDQHFSAVEENEGSTKLENFDWAQEFVGHFERAGEMFEQMVPINQPSVAELIAGMPYAAFSCGSDGRVVHENSHSRLLNGGESINNVFDLNFDAESERTLKSKLGTLPIEAKKPNAGKIVLRIYPENDKQPHLLICEVVMGKTLGGEPTFSGVILKSISAIWTSEVEETLGAAFDLTLAELELVSNLYRGLSIREISEWKGRSQATIRTQLSSVLSKTGTKSQPALARMIVGLVHMIVHKNRNAGPARPGLKLATNIPQRRIVIELSNGFEVEFVESGDFSGKPFYFIQPSTCPTLTPAIVEGLENRGIRLISPYKPGNGKTTRTPLSFTTKDWAKNHVEVIDRLGIGEFCCGGHCSGGVYAIELARLVGHRCKSVLLVDVGAPLTPAMIYAMPPDPRRLFVAARFFARLIVTPLKFMAADYFSGPKGEARAVEYFYEGSPTDQKIMHQPEHWQPTLENIGYSLKNVPQLARDISEWSKDNTTAFLEAARHSHLRFFHGGVNQMMQPHNIQIFCQAHANTSSNIVPDRAQLLIYAEQQIFVEEIAGQVQQFLQQ